MVVPVDHTSYFYSKNALVRCTGAIEYLRQKTDDFVKIWISMSVEMRIKYRVFSLETVVSAAGILDA